MGAKPAILIGLFLASQASILFAYPGENIVRDANGDYIITYWNGANLRQVKFVPATKIAPAVQSKLQLSDAKLITYRYTISNGRNARQPITSIRIGGITRVYGNKPMIPITSDMTPQAAVAAVESLSAPITKPDKWEGSANEDPKNNSALQVSWYFSTEDYPNETRIGVMPENKQQGFGFASFDLPGIGSMQLQGDTPIQASYGDEGPDPEESAIVPQLDQIHQNDFIARPIAAPLIAVPVPFDAAILLDRIRNHVATWPGRQLANPAFAAQLDRYLAAAADAYRLNQPKAGKEQIETLRKMLAKEHRYLDYDDEDHDDDEEHKTATRFSIDRLAARVLDFDLRYVLKRSSKEKERD